MGVRSPGTGLIDRQSWVLSLQEQQVALTTETSSAPFNSLYSVAQAGQSFWLSTQCRDHKDESPHLTSASMCTTYQEWTHARGSREESRLSLVETLTGFLGTSPPPPVSRGRGWPSCPHVSPSRLCGEELPLTGLRRTVSGRETSGNFYLGLSSAWNFTI